MSDERGPDPQAMSQEDRALAAQLDAVLRDEAEVYADVRVAGGVVYLDGVVESVAQRLSRPAIAESATAISLSRPWAACWYLSAAETELWPRRC